MNSQINIDTSSILELSDSLEILFKLLDEVSNSAGKLKTELEGSANSLKKLKDESENAEKKVEDLNQDVDKGSTSMAKLGSVAGTAGRAIAAGIAVGAAALVGLGVALKASADEAVKHERVITGMSRSVELLGFNYEESKDRLAEFMAERQKMTRYGSTDTAQLIDSLARMNSDIDLSISQLEILTGLTQDYASVTGQDASTAAGTLSRAIQGNTIQLIRANPHWRTQINLIQEIDDNAERAAAMMDFLGTQIGGAASELGDYELAIHRIKNGWSDVVIAIGDAVISSGTLSGILHIVADAADDVASAISFAFSGENAGQNARLFNSLIKEGALLMLALADSTLAFTTALIGTGVELGRILGIQDSMANPRTERAQRILGETAEMSASTMGRSGIWWGRREVLVDAFREGGRRGYQFTDEEEILLQDLADGIVRDERDIQEMARRVEQFLGNARGRERLSSGYEATLDLVRTMRAGIRRLELSVSEIDPNEVNFVERRTRPRTPISPTEPDEETDPPTNPVIAAMEAARNSVGDAHSTGVREAGREHERRVVDFENSERRRIEAARRAAELIEAARLREAEAARRAAELTKQSYMDIASGITASAVNSDDAISAIREQVGSLLISKGSAMAVEGAAELIALNPLGALKIGGGALMMAGGKALKSGSETAGTGGGGKSVPRYTMPDTESRAQAGGSITASSGVTVNFNGVVGDPRAVAAELKSLNSTGRNTGRIN